MTVKELIEKLQKLDLEQTVQVRMAEPIPPGATDHESYTHVRDAYEYTMGGKERFVVISAYWRANK